VSLFFSLKSNCRKKRAIHNEMEEGRGEERRDETDQNELSKKKVWCSRSFVCGISLTTFPIKPKVDTRKRLWLLTYGSASKDITHEMLEAQGINVDECYTAIWRESKFTLIRCLRDNRIRPETLEIAMAALEKSDGIALRATIIGYDSLSSMNKQKVDSLEDHPGFKKIIELLNMHSDDVKCWINGDKDVYDHRSGALWRYIETTDPKKMTQRQLASRVIAWTPIVNAHETLKAAYEAQTASLEAYKKQNEDLKFALEGKRAFIERQDKEITKLLETKKILSFQLIDAGIQPAVVPLNTTSQEHCSGSGSGSEIIDVEHLP